jgi:hypothetical protein
VKWTSAVSDQPTNADIENATSWLRVYENKNVRIVGIEHN